MSPFLNFFNKNKDSAVGIDIGSSSIKVVELKKKGDSAELVTYGILEIGPYAGMEVGRSVKLPVEKTVEALNDVIRESRVSTKVSGTSIPFRSSFMRLLELPQVTEEDLPKIVPIEARKYIPVPISEVALDWGLVPKVSSSEISVEDEKEKQANSKKSLINVLLVAIHKDVLTRFGDITKQANLDNQFLEVESYSSMRSVMPNSNESVMVCDIGAGGTKIYITYKGFVLTSHVINTGAEDMTMAISKSFNITIQDAEIMKREKGFVGDKDMKNVLDLVLNRITVEMDNIKDDFEKKYKTKVTKIILIGGGSQTVGIEKEIENEIKVEVKKGDAFEKIITPAVLRDTVSEIGPEFAVATGCALRALFDSE